MMSSVLEADAITPSGSAMNRTARALSIVPHAW